MRAIVRPDRIDISGARSEGSGFSWEPLLDDLKAEHVPFATPHGKRLSVALNPQGRLDALIYRTAQMPDDEVIRILNKHGITASIGQEHQPDSPCRILSLDGGGAKGFYTLGVLAQVEAMLKGRPLCENFELIFGTSTGAIIAALLSLGYSVGEIHSLYKQHVPTVMKNTTMRGRTKALDKLVLEVFGDKDFTHVKTGVGIVATHWHLEKPMIFKTSVAQAHGRKDTFIPGFGCKIGEAVRASCSAYPFFDRFALTTGQGITVELFDGGYCANNPTLYAVADAVKALGKSFGDLRVLSVGVGMYPEPKHWVTPKYMVAWLAKACLGFTGLQLLQKTLDVNTVSMEQLRSILFNDIEAVRINDTFQQPEMATDLLEADLSKLNLLYQRGWESFAAHEKALKRLFRVDQESVEQQI